MKRILVVDDQRSAVQALETLLRQDGYQVTGLSSGKGAVELLEHESFDAVVTDLEMPGSSGDEVTRVALAHHPETVVVVVSGRPEAPGCRRALALGARRVLRKPLEVEQLERELESTLGGP